MSRKINLIIIHCSATPEGREHTASDICKWHKQRGFKKIGYHWVIQLDGSVEAGREDEAGAHTTGHNKHSIGICYIGGLDKQMKPKDTRTELQKKALEYRVKQLLYDYPDAKVAGHYHFAAKACPCFDVEKWCEDVGIMEKNIYKKTK
jgi:N-acetylmuramoyl-L-alanine amidase